MVGLLALVFLSLYGYELFHFTFSIDEEYASSWTNPALNWLSQGRWGMALVSALLPPIWAMPFLSTALFGLGLIFAALALSKLFGYAPAEAMVFCVVFSLSPIWPHIVEFSTLSYGVGVGLIAFSLGSHLMFQRGAVALSLAVVCLCVSIGIYQTFAVLAALVVVNVALLHSTERSRSGSSESLVSVLLRGGFALGLATFVSLVAGFVALRAFGLEIRHIQGYVRVADYFQSFEPAFRKSLERALGFLVGTDETYLGWGLPILALPVLGLAVILWKALFPGRRTAGMGRATLVLVAAAGIITVLPIFLTAGETPARALIWFPLLFALLSAAALQLKKARMLIWILMGVNILASSFISNALFYADALAREQDRVIAYDLFRRIESLRRAPQDQRIPFTLVGA
ncbi:MAG: glucosyltransferase domain-containing protein, partial [Terriglobia bacterium]